MPSWGSNMAKRYFVVMGKMTLVRSADITEEVYFSAHKITNLGKG